MLSKRQYKALKTIKNLCNADKMLDSESFDTRFGDAGAQVLNEFGEMGLIHFYFEGAHFPYEGEVALIDYRNARKDIWEERIFRFASGLFTGLITGVGGTLIVQFVIMKL